LTAFYRAVGLPEPSAVVFSGGGLHVYWTSKTALTPDEWRPLAEGLKNAALKHGLRCDAGCTTDRARILRVPDTFNWKTGIKRPVKLLRLGECYDF
jgi:DNA primase catalytic subunit